SRRGSDPDYTLVHARLPPKGRLEERENGLVLFPTRLLLDLDERRQVEDSVATTVDLVDHGRGLQILVAALPSDGAENIQGTETSLEDVMPRTLEPLACRAD